MIDEKKEPLKEKLSRARDELLQWTRTLHESDWTQAVYAHDEVWTVRDVFCHLIWAEGGMARLIQQIRQGEEGVPADFDVNRYNARGVRKLQEKPLAELLSMMTKNRDWILQILDELSPEELQRKGRHGTLRIMSIEDVLHMIADHERQHLGDLRQAVSGA